MLRFRVQAVVVGFFIAKAHVKRGSQDLDHVPGCSTLSQTNGLSIHVRAEGCQIGKRAEALGKCKRFCVQAYQVAKRIQLTFKRELLPMKSSLPLDVVCTLRTRHL